MKKKILIIAMSFIVLAMTVASVTTAYFTDTDEATNVFTVGEVKIELNETNTDYTGKTVETNAEGAYAFGNLYPGQSYTKIANIKNTGSESAYLAAKITLTSANLDGRFLKNDGSVDEATLREFLVGLVTADAGYVVTFDAVADADDTIVVRVVKTAATIKEDNFNLMTSVYVDETWDNEEVADLANLKIQIQAFGVQTVGFAATADKTAAEVAIAAAFPEF